MFLANCAHCGANIPYVSKNLWGDKDLEDDYWIECEYCGVKTKKFRTEEEAVEAWNMRVPSWISIEEEPKEDLNQLLLTCDGQCYCFGDFWKGYFQSDNCNCNRPDITHYMIIKRPED